MKFNFSPIRVFEENSTSRKVSIFNMNSYYWTLVKFWLLFRIQLNLLVIVQSYNLMTYSLISSRHSTLELLCNPLMFSFIRLRNMFHSQSQYQMPDIFTASLFFTHLPREIIASRIGDISKVVGIAYNNIMDLATNVLQAKVCSS